MDIVTALASIEQQLACYETIGVSNVSNVVPESEPVCHIRRNDLEILCAGMEKALKIIEAFLDKETPVPPIEIDGFWYCPCPYCDCEGKPKGTLNDFIHIHDADCPWVMARKMLGIEGGNKR